MHGKCVRPFCALMLILVFVFAVMPIENQPQTVSLPRISHGLWILKLVLNFHNPSVFLSSSTYGSRVFGL